MNSKVEDGEDSDMEDMAYMEEKKWETGDSEELIRVQEISKTFHLSAKQRKMEHSASKTKTAVDQVSFCVKRGEVFDFWDLTVPVRPQRFGCWQR